MDYQYLLSINVFLVFVIVTFAQPSVNVYPCQYGDYGINFSNTTHLSNFRLVDNSTVASEQTFASVCYDEEYLNIQTTNFDDNIYSPFTDCNDDLYKADAFEVFLAYGSNQPEFYLEIELSPMGVLFVSKIYNPGDACSTISGTLIDCGQSGIIYNATVYDQFNTWVGTLRIPLELIYQTSSSSSSEGSSQPLTPSTLRFNMFRIDVPLNSPMQFACWNPTDANPPCFHIPSAFGYMNFQ
ncbi:hypothetical protein DLAC_00440 [Tieghemostelium lacteum]|uniref:Uncharacterized protein n=1 Tax=Tieghemostelium lacteum TaxID=361077 RepID=A0A152AA59_TIELA|nr:hypothetical protein DLAC_00440 [Tieghemostelium lacteum]|eukprot:KYR02957.1 hypothetical protein DLAC_00440 [Tieghemostelium lacteum]